MVLIIIIIIFIVRVLVIIILRVIVRVIALVIVIINFFLTKMDFNLDANYVYNNDIHKSKIIKKINQKI